MKIRNDISPWPMALVLGSFIALALFMVVPALQNQQAEPESVIEVDFMQWREPARAPKVKISAPKPMPVKSKPVVQQSKPQVKPIELPIPIPVIREPVINEQQTQPKQRPVEHPPVTLEITPQPVPTETVKPEEYNDEDLPAATPIFQLTALPRFAHKVEPQYPQSMRALGREAQVKLAVLIDAKGKVRKVTVLLSGGDVFDEAAKTALLASAFIPGNTEGKAVAVSMRIPITFRLN